MKNLHRIKKEVPLLLGIAALCLGTVTVQAGQGEPSSEVYIDVIERDTHMLLSVTVPTTYAFVVNGTTDATSRVEISVDKKTLLLPNITVKVKDPTSAASDYELQVSGSGKLPFKNYSTITAEKKGDGTPNYDRKIRQCVPVLVDGYLRNAGDTILGRSYWEAVAEDTEVTVEEKNFKNYKIALGESPTVYQFNKVLPAKPGQIWLNQKILLEKPLETDGYDAVGLAVTPSVLELPLEVKIGGYRGQYKQVEESVKAGKIIWNIELKP